METEPVKFQTVWPDFWPSFVDSSVCFFFHGFLKLIIKLIIHIRGWQFGKSISAKKRSSTVQPRSMGSLALQHSKNAPFMSTAFQLGISALWQFSFSIYIYARPGALYIGGYWLASNKMWKAKKKSTPWKELRKRSNWINFSTRDDLVGWLIYGFWFDSSSRMWFFFRFKRVLFSRYHVVRIVDRLTLAGSDWNHQVFFHHSWKSCFLKTVFKVVIETLLQSIARGLTWAWYSGKVFYYTLDCTLDCRL